jgi:hypothetical protein
MAKKSRDKGKAAEREVVNRFISEGVPCRRRWEEQSRSGGQELGDLAIGGTGVGRDELPIYAEVRRRAQQLDIPAWLREVEEKAPLGHYRAVIFRRDREDWHVAIPLDEYIDLLKDRFR